MRQLSMIVPTYNCEAYLREGLDSILDQMSREHELIVVDDGSTDGTREKLAEYEEEWQGRRREQNQEQEPNLRIRYESHRGASAARNIGLEMADGRYVAFMDCDDCMEEGFLEKSRPMLEKNGALYIFGIRRELLSGEIEDWSVNDQVYDSMSDFADEYIRKRKMLIYSNCNKFYSRRIIEEAQICFEEGVAFGEDRLFNYRYLIECGKLEDTGVVTSSLTMLRYIERKQESMSTKPIPDYHRQIIRLHREKMNCFLGLSRGTTEEERQDFEEYDLSKELLLENKGPGSNRSEKGR